MSPYSRNSYAFGKESFGNLRAHVLIQGVDEAARTIERLQTMGIASKKTAESALFPVPDKPSHLCVRHLPRPVEIAPSNTSRGPRTRKKSGKKTK